MILWSHLPPWTNALHSSVILSPHPFSMQFRYWIYRTGLLKTDVLRDFLFLFLFDQQAYSGTHFFKMLTEHSVMFTAAANHSIMGHWFVFCFFFSFAEDLTPLDQTSHCNTGCMFVIHIAQPSLFLKFCSLWKPKSRSFLHVMVPSILYWVPVHSCCKDKMKEGVDSVSYSCSALKC